MFFYVLTIRAISIITTVIVLRMASNFIDGVKMEKRNEIPWIIKSLGYLDDLLIKAPVLFAERLLKTQVIVLPLLLIA